MVGGGLPVGSSIILQGPPGQEKLRFALTFLAEGLKSGGSGLIVTSSQSPDAVLAELRDLGVNLDSVTNENRLRVVDWYSWSEETVHDIEERGIVIRSSIDLTNLGVALSRAIAALARGPPPRAVIELLSPATGSYEVTQVYAFAQSAKRKFDRHEFTSLVLVEKEMHSSPQLTTLHQPFDGVIEIERTRSGDRIVRKIGVLHLKDTAPDPTFRILEMSESGMRVVREGSKTAAPTSLAPGGVLESQDERAQRLRLILQIATERLKLNPGDADALFAMAAAQATLDDAKGGLQTLDRLAQLDSAYPGLWVLKTKLHAKLGQGDLARASRIRAQETEPEAAKTIDATVPCPMCEAPVAIDATTCANCGVKFAASRTLEEELDDLGKAAIQEMVEEDLGAAKEREKTPEKPAAPAPKQKSERTVPSPSKPTEKAPSKKGLTNGLVLERRGGPKAGRTNGLGGRTNGLRGRTNGIGRTNGLTNGMGRTNGLTSGLGRSKGLTNGLGRTNGLTNGLGRTNGITNGLGRTNGLTNGLGRTNGITNGLGRTNGLTNGLGGLRGRGFRSGGSRGSLRSAGWKLYLIPLVVVSLLLLPLFNIPGYGGPAYPIQIDGRFADWDTVPKLSPAGHATLNPDIDIVRVAVVDNRDYLSFYIEVRGNVLAGGPAPSRVTDAYYAFVDVDRSRSTGYAIQGLGADRMIAILTWGGEVVSASVKSYNESRGPTDWSAWQQVGTAFAAGSGSQLEFEIPRTELTQTQGSVQVAFASRSWDGQSDVADVTASNVSPFLLVSQSTAAPSVVNGTLGVLSHFTLTAVGGPVHVDGMNVSLRGTFGLASVSALDLVDEFGNLLSEQPPSSIVRFSFPAITLSANETRIFAVRAKVNVADGTTMGAFIRDIQDVSGPLGIAFLRPLSGPASLAYIGFAPTGPVVDGAFADWQNATVDPTGDVQPIYDPDIDLTGYSFQGYHGDTYFALSVLATALNGTMVPALNPTYVPSSGNGSGGGFVSPSPPPVNGTDSIRFYVDSDGSPATGYAVGGIGADFLVEVTGKEGKILTSQAKRFAGTGPFDWQWTLVGTSPAANTGSWIEAGLLGVAVTNASRAYFETTGWSGAKDDSVPPSPPVVIFSVSAFASGGLSQLGSGGASPQGNFDVSTQVLSGNQQWFFTSVGPTAPSPGDCPTANKFGASTTAGSSATSTTLSSAGQAICWYTPAGQPLNIVTGTAKTWEVTLDISNSGSSSYTLAIYQCTSGNCASTSTLYTTTSSSFGTPVSFTPSITVSSFGSNDRIEFRITWASGSVTVAYNGASGGGSDSWASIPIPEFGDEVIPIFFAGLAAIIVPRWFRRTGVRKGLRART